MPDKPKPGDLFAIAGRRDYLTVKVCHLAITDDLSGVTRYLVTAVAGSRWRSSHGLSRMACGGSGRRSRLIRRRRSLSA